MAGALIKMDSKTQIKCQGSIRIALGHKFAANDIIVRITNHSPFFYLAKLFIV